MSFLLRIELMYFSHVGFTTTPGSAISFESRETASRVWRIYAFQLSDAGMTAKDAEVIDAETGEIFPVYKSRDS